MDRIVKPESLRLFRPILLVMIGLLGVELLSILVMTDGHLIFSLDDPYINFALSDQIRQGRYGIHPLEPSAPASSILWPFLIAPFTALPYVEWFVFLINAGFSCATVWIVWKNVHPAIRDNSETHPQRFAYYAMFVLVVTIGNLVGLVFVGMEHSLQVFLAVSVVAGLWSVASTGHCPRTLLISLTLIPFVRLEALSIVAPALLYLFFSGQRIRAFAVGLIVSVFLVLFSWFLYSQGLGFISSSVMAKSEQMQGGHILYSITANAMRNLHHPVGVLLLAATLSLLPAVLRGGRSLPERGFALVIMTAGFLHLLAGGLWWYGRYEAYALISIAFCALLIYRARVGYLLNQKKQTAITVQWLLPMFVLSLSSFFILATTPIMSKAIYLQPFQFHRFATEYYKKPIAVNDLGLVSYKNPHFVLDLFGLGSVKALRGRLTSSDPEWMDVLCREYGVGLVIIQESWFPRRPGNWIKVAHFERHDLTSRLPGMRVGFFATTQKAAAEAIPALKEFQKVLISPTELVFLAQ